MKLTLILHIVFSSLIFAITMTLAISMSKPGCQEKCGNITVPYPFGIDLNCSGYSSFTLISNKSTNPPKLLLSSIKMEVLNISLRGTIIVKQPVSPVKCSAMQRTKSLPISLEETTFTFSARYNSLAVLGCENSVWLRANETTTVGGCTALCDANSTDTNCNGVNCCQTTIPPRLKELVYTHKSTEASNNGFCGYVFPVDKKWLKKGYRSYRGYREIEFVPLVLEWEFGKLKGLSNDTCTYSDDYCLTYPDDYGRRSFNYLTIYNSYGECRSSHGDYSHLHERGLYYYGGSYQYLEYKYNDYYGSEYGYYVSSTKYCSCPDGYEGNPYLPGGCRDIDECSNSTWNYCHHDVSTCKNTQGSYMCVYENNKSRVKIAFISIGSALGGLILLIVAFMSTRAIRKRIKANQKSDVYIVSILLWLSFYLGRN